MTNNSQAPDSGTPNNGSQPNDVSPQQPPKPQRRLRTDFDRGEQITALVWICLAALVSLLLEVVYLNSYLPLGGTLIPFPITILLAFWFNSVLTKTARLWSTHPAFILAPVAVWTVGFMALFLIEVTGHKLLANNIYTVCLLFAGVAGGLWPFMRQK